MNKVKTSRPSATIWMAIAGAIALVCGTLLYKSDRLFVSQSPVSATDTNGSRPPMAGQPSAASTKGTFRSTGSPVPQSLSGKPMSDPPTIAKGQVVDGVGKGVPDARIRCSNCKTSGAMVLTDEGGHFTLPYYFEPGNDSRPLELVVSKGDRIAKHPVTVATAGNLVLKLK